jgi:multiple sugar transport system permease protein
MFKSALKKERVTPYLFVMPAIIVLVFLLIYPIIKVIEYSLFDGVFMSKTPTFVGLDNFIHMFTQDKSFYPILGHTVLFTVASVVLHLILGFVFAATINQPMNKAANSIFRVILILPWIFTASIVALNWRLILAPSGIVNYIIGFFGLPAQDWYGNPKLAMFSLIVTNAWRGYPFFMVSLLAGLQSIPLNLYEAASVDGAHGLQKHLYITLPLLKPVIVSISLLDTIWTFQIFPIVWLTTGGGPMGVTEVLATSIYRQAFFKMNYSMASAQAVVILLIATTFSFFYLRQQRQSME